MENSITVGEELRKYFYESGLNFFVQRSAKTHSGNDSRYGTEGAQREND